MATIRRIDSPIDTRGPSAGARAGQGAAGVRKTVATITPAARTVFYPWIRVELLIRTLTGRTWDAATWPVMREQLRHAYALRALARRAQYWNWLTGARAARGSRGRSSERGIERQPPWR